MAKNCSKITQTSLQFSACFWNQFWSPKCSEYIKYDNVAEVVKWADLISVLIPDKTIPEVYNKEILPYLTKGNTLLFSHGFNVYYKYITYPEYVNVNNVTLEMWYYRHLFETYNYKQEIIPYFWMPRFVDAKDASARTLKIYSEVKSS